MIAGQDGGRAETKRMPATNRMTEEDRVRTMTGRGHLQGIERCRDVGCCRGGGVSAGVGKAKELLHGRPVSSGVVKHGGLDRLLAGGGEAQGALEAS